MKTLQIKVFRWQDKVWDDLVRGSVSGEMYSERKRGDRSKCMRESMMIKECSAMVLGGNVIGNPREHISRRRNTQEIPRGARKDQVHEETLCIERGKPLNSPLQKREGNWPSLVLLWTV